MMHKTSSYFVIVFFSLFFCNAPRDREGHDRKAGWANMHTGNDLLNMRTKRSKNPKINAAEERKKETTNEKERDMRESSQVELRYESAHRVNIYRKRGEGKAKNKPLCNR